MIAFDKHMNIVLADCEEYRTLKLSKHKKQPANLPEQRQEERRTHGLVVLRGEVIVSMVVESGAPPESSKKRKSALASLTGANMSNPVRGGQIFPPQLAPFPGGKPLLGLVPNNSFPLVPGMPPSGFNSQGQAPSTIPGIYPYPPTIPGMMPPLPPSN